MNVQNSASDRKSETALSKSSRHAEQCANYRNVGLLRS